LFTGNVSHAAVVVYSALLTVYSALSATRVHSRQSRVPAPVDSEVIEA